MGGLIGGEAISLDRRRKINQSVYGDTMARSVAIAMGTLEVNASMGLIVAAPTAGSCGVLPGGLPQFAEQGAPHGVHGGNDLVQGGRGGDPGH